MKGILILVVILSVLITGNFAIGCGSKNCICHCNCYNDCLKLPNNTMTGNHGKTIVSEAGVLNDEGECICECPCCPGPPKPQNKCANCSYNGEYVYLIGDCTKYCVCHEDLPCDIVECPKGLYFDHKMQRCEKYLCSDCPYKPFKSSK
ncbi:hypothetical protein ACFFRR_007528 [Megaselia abdita]